MMNSLFFTFSSPAHEHNLLPITELQSESRKLNLFSFLINVSASFHFHYNVTSSSEVIYVTEEKVKYIIELKIF